MVNFYTLICSLLPFAHAQLQPAAKSTSPGFQVADSFSKMNEA
jgi:hypothetical protein